MHIYNLEQWQPQHDFHIDYQSGERRSLFVLALTAVTMVVEIAAGTVFGSMALLADGWHMATHVAAFAITIFAYQYARKHKDNPQYAYGTGKVSVLGGFASAVALAVVALMMAVESIMRMISPESIMFTEAILVAIVGLIVNIISVLMLHDDHSHGHGHHHDHHHQDHHHHHDHNLTAAYYHVLADAFTSILAIAALLCGRYFGWLWMDALMGVVGAVVISKWAYGLLKQSSQILLDRSIDAETKNKIVKAIETDRDNRVVDLHGWYINPKHTLLIVSVVTHYPQPPDHYKELIKGIHDFVHITVEVHTCESEPCIPLPTESTL